MARLLLLRHGQSTWNAEGRWQGWADPPLSAEGRAQAAAAAARLTGTGVTAMVTSDLGRARETAEILAAALGLPGERLEIDADLRERNVGEWSGLTRAQIERRWPGQLAAWRNGQLERPPGGESRAELSARVVRALDRLASRPPEEVVLAVTHGGVIHLVERHLGGEAGGTGNLCGRWIEPGPILGGVVVVPEDEAGITTVL